MQHKSFSLIALLALSIAVLPACKTGEKVSRSERQAPPPQAVLSSDRSSTYLISKQELMALKESATEQDFMLKIYDIITPTDSNSTHYVMVLGANKPGFPTLSGSIWIKSGRKCPPMCESTAAKAATIEQLTEEQQSKILVKTECLLVPSSVLQNAINGPTISHMSIMAAPGMRPKIMTIEQIVEGPARMTSSLK